jgi:HK97 family phage portal protein
MKLRWRWWEKPTEDQAPAVLQRSLVSISDPNLEILFGGIPSSTGTVVSERTAMSLTAVWRAISLIAGTIASLPLRTIETSPDGERRQVASWLDNPSGPGLLVPFAWKELVLFHLLTHGNAYLLKLFNGAGAQVGAWPVHPNQVGVSFDWERAPVDGKVFSVTLDDGQTMTLTSADITHVMGMSSDGRMGLSPLAIARDAFGVALAGDAAAGHMFRNGALASAIVTSDGEELTLAEAHKVKAQLMSQMTGAGNAGNIAVINRKLKITPWSLSAADAQFLESRQFSIEEIARIYGVAPHLLMQMQKSTSFGTGITEQNLALGRHTLMPWTARLEEYLSRELTGARRVAEFDFTPLERPNPKDEVGLLIQQVNAGLISVNEARTIRGLPGVGVAGDALRNPTNTVPGPVTTDAVDPDAVATGAGSDG